MCEGAAINPVAQKKVRETVRIEKFVNKCEEYGNYEINHCACHKKNPLFFIY